jgi:hypothetical protein
MQDFVISIIAGLLFPLVPIGAEYGLKYTLAPDVVALTAIVYVAAVGMDSRFRAIAVSGFFASMVCAIIYVAELYGHEDQSKMPLVLYGRDISAWIIFVAAVSYTLEHFSRHCVDDEPFLGF